MDPGSLWRAAPGGIVGGMSQWVAVESYMTHTHTHVRLKCVCIHIIMIMAATTDDHDGGVGDYAGGGGDKDKMQKKCMFALRDLSF